MQASAYIPTSIFEEFELKEDVIFKINLSILVECLCMFWGDINTQGSSVALLLLYKVGMDKCEGLFTQEIILNQNTI